MITVLLKKYRKLGDCLSRYLVMKVIADLLHEVSHFEEIGLFHAENEEGIDDVRKHVVENMRKFHADLQKSVKEIDELGSDNMTVTKVLRMVSIDTISTLDKTLEYFSFKWDETYHMRMANKKLETIKEELMSKTWNPSRLKKWCLDIEEITDLFGKDDK